MIADFDTATMRLRNYEHTRQEQTMSEDVKPYSYEGFKQRVEDERRELDGRLSKLSAFIATDIFGKLPVNEQVRLKEQQLYMRAYADVLGHRLNNDFK